METKLRAKTLDESIGILYFEIFDIRFSDPQTGIFHAKGIACYMNSIQQFTGKKDSQDRDIYEGDIVDLVNEEKYKEETQMSGRRIVVWNNESAIFFFDKYVVMNWGGHVSKLIIGNNIMNPELAKEIEIK